MTWTIGRQANSRVINRYAKGRKTSQHAVMTEWIAADGVNATTFTATENESPIRDRTLSERRKNDIAIWFGRLVGKVRDTFL
jgi:protein-disulfide isomerase-like protein with CxxC motif